MTTLIALPTPDDDTPRAAVAAEVRGHLAKRKIPTYRLPEVLGGSEGRGYWQRRVSGEIAFDIDDLARIASMLGVTINALIPKELPGHDSNVQPIGSTPAPENNVSPIDFARARRIRPDHPSGIGTVTPIIRTAGEH